MKPCNPLVSSAPLRRAVLWCPQGPGATQLKLPISLHPRGDPGPERSTYKATEPRQSPRVVPIKYGKRCTFNRQLDKRVCLCDLCVLDKKDFKNSPSPSRNISKQRLKTTGSPGDQTLRFCRPVPRSRTVPHAVKGGLWRTAGRCWKIVFQTSPNHNWHHVTRGTDAKVSKIIQDTLKTWGCTSLSWSNG